MHKPPQALTGISVDYIDGLVSNMRRPYHHTTKSVVTWFTDAYICLNAAIIRGEQPSLRRRHMSIIASRITDNSTACLTFGAGWRQWKQQMPRMQAFMDSLHKGPVTQKVFPCHGVMFSIHRTGNVILMKFHHWLHWELSKWQFPVYSRWWKFRNFFVSV